MFPKEKKNSNIVYNKNNENITVRFINKLLVSSKFRRIKATNTATILAF